MTTVSHSGERTRLACRIRRLAECMLSLFAEVGGQYLICTSQDRNMKIKVRDGEAPSPAREARALPGVPKSAVIDRGYSSACLTSCSTSREAGKPPDFRPRRPRLILERRD